MVECFRRLALACALGLVSDEDSVASPTVGLCLCLCFLYVFTKLEPYRYTPNTEQSALQYYTTVDSPVPHGTALPSLFVSLTCPCPCPCLSSRYRVDEPRLNSVGVILAYALTLFFLAALLLKARPEVRQIWHDWHQ